MTETAELEAALDAAWSLDNLAVYGDHLQQLGDPRGELIAVDVHIARHGATGDVLHRRRRALRAWLGLEPNDDPTKGQWAKVHFANGFVEDAAIEIVPRVLASPAAPFVRGLTLAGRTTAIDHALGELARVPRPWLTRLAIAPKFRGEPPGRTWRREQPNLSREPLPALIRGTPRLAELELIGHRLVEEFPHPKLQRLVIRGLDAFLALFDLGRARTPMPAVRDLVLTFAREPGEPVIYQRPWPPLAPAETFPALRRLDLSGNEAQRSTTDTQVGVFEVLADLGVLGQLEELRLPSIRNGSEARIVQRAIERMPALRRVEVARGWGKHALRHDTAELVELELPWPLHAIAIPDTELWFAFEGDPDLLFVRPREAIALCDRVQADDTRAAWTPFWHALAQLPDPESPAVGISAAQLGRALDGVGHLDARDPLWHWRRLRARARLAGPHEQVWLARRRAALDTSATAR